MKRIICFLLTLSIALTTLLSVGGFVYAADNDYVVEYVYYYDEETETEGRAYAITKYTGNDAVLNIPSVINGNTITRINGIRNNAVVAITLPDSVTVIGNSAFSSCENLVSIDLGKNTETIEERAFSGCKNLKNISFGNKLKRIGESVFSGCTNISSISIPEPLEELGNCCFNRCVRLTDISLPDTLEKIGYECFCECKALTTLTIPNSVKNLGCNVIDNCTSLITLNIGDGITKLYDFGYSSVQIITLGKSVSLINIKDNNYDDDYYYEYHRDIFDTFQSCNNLIKIIVDDDNEYFSSDDYALYNKNKTVVYKGFGGSEKEKLIIPNTVLSINARAYSNCPNYKEVVIPDSVIAVGNNAFSSCSSLEKVKIGNGLSRISSYCFYNCKHLKDIDFGTSINTIGSDAFYFYRDYVYDYDLHDYVQITNDLECVVLPENVEVVESSAFSNLKYMIVKNKNCQLAESGGARYIGSYSGGKVESFCKNNNIKFIDIDTYNCNEAEHYYIEKEISRATCTEDGEAEYTCLFCNDSYTAEKPATGHDKTIEYRKATTSDNGYIRTYCKTCYRSMSETVYIPRIAEVKLTKTTYVYNGKTYTPNISVKDADGKALSEDEDYTVIYPDGRKNAGTYTIKVRFKGNYSGTEYLEFTIIPAPTSLVSLTKKSKAILVKWNKNTNNTSGYQIQVATDKYFTKNKKNVTVKGNAKTSATVKKLKSKKRYYVRIRTYKTVSGKKIFSNWSSIKSTKTK